MSCSFVGNLGIAEVEGAQPAPGPVVDTIDELDPEHTEFAGTSEETRLDDDEPVEPTTDEVTADGDEVADPATEPGASDAAERASEIKGP